MEQDQRRPLWAVVAQLLGVVLLCGCSTAVGLSQTPNLYLGGRTYPDKAVPAVLQVIDPPMFFVTDRMPLGGQGRVTGYGAGRSDAMAFGRADVQFQAGGWADLVERTYVDRGRRMSRLDVARVEEIVRFPLIPLQMRRSDGGLRVTDEAQRAYGAQEDAFKAAVQAEVKRTGNGRVLVYVHGVGNDFDNALQTLASLWHFSGRRSTPVAFTWPAGNGGALGYFRDREAADFSVFHAKEFLRLIAEIPEVEDIDIVAHSRGTSVMTQALRETVIYHQGRGVPPKLAMKTGTLILAAPDLDTGVARQRIASERVSEAFEQVNIYVNPDDTALRLSSFLTKYPRIGAAEKQDFGPGELAQLRKEGLVHFIRVEGASGSHSHSYFRQNPAVLSDIVLALRTRAFPGGTLRPLEEDADLFWRLQPNYPLDRLPDLEIEPGQ
ncbi:alpha/beta hydrolase [uncultured Sulfitobacter sp.]|uniref:alpha/beta hydrolase n=1 Tax=uncultured Sulfitobacter sp. TaxID=191468 RepID=UPI0026304DF5|nr:alpha/beta hydrolase [uncultured Sulfitobacter sp.]